MSSPRNRVPESSSVEIESPVANGHHVITAAGITVAGRAGSNVERVYVRILRAGIAPAADPAVAGWDSVVPDGNGDFSLANVTGGVTQALTGSADNKAVAIPKLNGGGFGTPALVLFVGRPQSEDVEVSARHCVWFSFASDNEVGPGPANDRETSMVGHRPPPIIVPRNAGTMTVEAFGTWRHFHPQGGADNAASDADGMNPTVGLELAGYKDALYGSLGIGDVPQKVNSLIALWTDVADTPVGDPFLLGKGPTTTGAIDDTTWRVRFAFHDGKRWHNNSGSVLATVTWNLVVNRLRVRRRPF